jgi:UDP-N-acetylglucosamine 2-epimerase (non-hydrolysing)
MHTVLVAFGTRPEGIKLAPVIRALRERARLRVVVANVGQHAEMLDQHMAPFEITPDHHLKVIRPGQPLDELTGRALVEIAGVIRSEAPDLVVVQGDTTTVFASALAAFYERVPVAHVEAGLRTGIPDLPFPEEMNRRLIGAITRLHFPPTDAARNNLLREGVEPSHILVTGNTVIDAVRWMSERAETPPELKPILDDPRRLIVVTAHRRESWGMPMDQIAEALARLAGQPDVLIVFPIHPNPIVRGSVFPRVEGLDNVVIIEPLAYPAFVRLMAASTLLLTDSGGIQEEAAALGKPVLVMREVTERAEGVATGTSVMVGREVDVILEAAGRLLRDPAEYQRRAGAPNPYGDGRAAERIADSIEAFFEDPGASA